MENEPSKESRQIAAIVRTQLSGDAIRCWCKIMFCEGGKVDVLTIALDDLGLPASELIGEGWAKVVRTSVVAIDPIGEYGQLAELEGEEQKLAALTSPHLRGAEPVIAETTEGLFKFYNERRREAGDRC